MTERDRLADLVRADRVRFIRAPSGLVRETTRFKADIDQRLRPRVNLAIRPKRKKR